MLNATGLMMISSCDQELSKYRSYGGGFSQGIECVAEDTRQYPPHCQMMRNALRAKDWQQDVIAAVMGQSRSTVNSILTGRQKLTARLAIDYGHVLQLAPEELLTAQGAWELEMDAPRIQHKIAAIKLRREEVEARVVGDRKAEINALLKQRKVIDDRIAHLSDLGAESKAA